jgi:nitrogen fixation protein NifU and related proteins
MNLYSKELMQLAKKNSLGSGVLDEATHDFVAKNPICGDRVRWTAIVVGEEIVDLKHHTKGCLLCKASASLLFEQIHETGRKTTDVHELICQYSSQIEQLKTGDVSNVDTDVQLFKGLQKAPSRVACVLLPFEGLQMALQKKG